MSGGDVGKARMILAAILQAEAKISPEQAEAELSASGGPDRRERGRSAPAAGAA